MMTSKTLFSGLLALAASTPLWIASTPSANAATSRLQGVWEVSGVPDASSGIAPFTNLVTIEADGALVNVDPGLGAGVGEARRSGPRSYTAGFFGFMDAGGEAIYEVQGTLTLMGPDAWAGPFRTRVSDLSGNLLFEYEGTVSGIRRHAQPY